jgi:hypothetical protein
LKFPFANRVRRLCPPSRVDVERNLDADCRTSLDGHTFRLACGLTVDAGENAHRLRVDVATIRELKVRVSFPPQTEILYAAETLLLLQRRVQAIAGNEQRPISDEDAQHIHGAILPKCT